MVLALWISLVGVSLVVSLTPGAGAINTMSNALAVGWRRAFWGVAGQQFGILAHIAVAAAGIGVLITSSPVAFAAVRYVGAGYLIFIGLKQFFARPSVVEVAVQAEPAVALSADYAAGSVSAMSTGSLQVLTHAPARTTEVPIQLSAPVPVEAGPSASKLMRRGFWVNILNPKAVVFFLAIMPQFISADLPAMPQYLIIAITMTVIDMTIMTFVFAAAAEQFRRFTGSPRGQVIANRIFGTLFVLIAAVMLVLN
ncbi:LysE family transporter [Leucobacter salsicius]|uniref:LysE family transporter n=1 Tax=Leucobacter salsicius TaxID=664638 RepID=UPI00034DF09D|nr:LysE family transporter [Leucobacter salsicius]